LTPAPAFGLPVVYLTGEMCVRQSTAVVCLRAPGHGEFASIVISQSAAWEIVAWPRQRQKFADNVLLLACAILGVVSGFFEIVVFEGCFDGLWLPFSFVFALSCFVLFLFRNSGYTFSAPLPVPARRSPPRRKKEKTRGKNREEKKTRKTRVTKTKNAEKRERETPKPRKRRKKKRDEEGENETRGPRPKKRRKKNTETK
jgi:hypothetical protein